MTFGQATDSCKHFVSNQMCFFSLAVFFWVFGLPLFSQDVESEVEIETEEEEQAHVLEERDNPVKAILPANTHTVWNNGYFRLMRDTRYTDAKMWVCTKWCVDAEMGRKDLSKTLQILSFDDSLDEPVQTFLVLRAWMLWRAAQNKWHERIKSRRDWYSGELRKLQADCGEISLSMSATKEIRKWCPQVL